MSPLEQIEHGLQNGDLSAIAEAYKQLTGKTLQKKTDKPPKEKAKRGRKPKLKVVSPTPEEVQTFTKEPEAPSVQKVERPKTGNNKDYCTVLPFVMPQENQFKDDIKLHKKDISIDKKLQKGVQRSSRREEVSIVTLRCSKCGRGSEVSEQFQSQFADPNISDDTRPQYICENCQV